MCLFIIKFRNLEDNIKTGPQEVGWRVWIGSIWLGIGICGALLRTQ